MIKNCAAIHDTIPLKVFVSVLKLFLSLDFAVDSWGELGVEDEVRINKVWEMDGERSEETNLKQVLILFLLLFSSHKIGWESEKSYMRSQDDFS